MYENLGNTICRRATISDFSAMYNIMVPYVKQDVELRKLKKYLKYYITKGNSCVIEEHGNIVGLFAGNNNFINYLVCRGSFKATLLLFYVVMCGIHNMYEETTFIAFDSNKELFKKLRTPDGKACIIDSEGNGTVPVDTKQSIEKLFRRFKYD